MTLDAATTDMSAPKPPRWFGFRIAVSLLFGLLTLLLCVLWVRSYWWVDIIEVSSRSGDDLREVMSGCGVVVLHNWSAINGRWAGGILEHDILPAQPKFVQHFREISKFQVNVDVDGWGLNLPYWFLAAVAATISALPWVHPKFSLRTMLIATTLLAMMLGFFVWAIR